MPKPETKLICGFKHKRVPCQGCGEMIWVSSRHRKSRAYCTNCYGKVGNFATLGRDEDCTHDIQYGGDCTCE